MDPPNNPYTRIPDFIAIVLTDGPLTLILPPFCRREKGEGVSASIQTWNAYENYNQ